MSAPRLGCVTASSLGGTNPREKVEVAPDDLALIQFSSGTTHDPKPVALTHQNLLSNLAVIEQYSHASAGIRSGSHGCRSITTWD